jgi:hypothetical protein
MLGFWFFTSNLKPRTCDHNRERNRFDDDHRDDGPASNHQLHLTAGTRDSSARLARDPFVGAAP